MPSPALFRPQHPSWRTAHPCQPCTARPAAAGSAAGAGRPRPGPAWRQRPARACSCTRAGTGPCSAAGRAGSWHGCTPLQLGSGCRGLAFQQDHPLLHCGLLGAQRTGMQPGPRLHRACASPAHPPCAARAHRAHLTLLIPGQSGSGHLACHAACRPSQAKREPAAAWAAPPVGLPGLSGFLVCAASSCRLASRRSASDCRSGDGPRATVVTWSCSCSWLMPLSKEHPVPFFVRARSARSAELFLVGQKSVQASAGGLTAVL